MNAMDMMMKAAFEKLLAGIPPETLQTIGQIGQIALSLRAQLDRIENQQRLLMAHLNIPAETEIKELPHGRQQ